MENDRCCVSQPRLNCSRKKEEEKKNYQSKQNKRNRMSKDEKQTRSGVSGHYIEGRGCIGSVGLPTPG